MRLVELITIYLASAAPVGVIAFLRQSARDESRPIMIARAFAAGLLFPLTLFAYALKLRRGVNDANDPEAHGAKIDAARRALLAALHNFEDRAREIGDSRDAKMDDGRRAKTCDAAHALTSHVERYVGLTLALAHAEPAGELDERETELARVAGRAGDDLEVAGRCVRRRNLSRLRERQSQSRLELLHALADLRDTLGPSAAHPLAPALLRVYERAFSLFMLLADERGTQSLTRLLDATRSRLYRQHESQTHDGTAARSTRRDSTGDAPCRPHNSRTTNAQPLSTPRTATSTQRTQTLPTPLSARG
jgi:hypothetical protein